MCNKFIEQKIAEGRLNIISMIRLPFAGACAEDNAEHTQQ
jgi:hypothetical protein